jgi:glycosyltransferase involved in cell wall biosynthesis
MRLGLDDRIIFDGGQANDEARAALAASDLLILSSRGDGWGIVVNQALAHSFPAMSIDRSEAQDLLDGSERGEVVPTGSAEALVRTGEKRITLGRPRRPQRQRIADRPECISGNTAARYLPGILDHVCGGQRPVPPRVRA